MTLSEAPLVLLGQFLGLLGALILVVGLLAVVSAWLLVALYDRHVREASRRDGCPR